MRTGRPSATAHQLRTVAGGRVPVGAAGPRRRRRARRSRAVEIQRSLNQLGTPQDSPELRQQLQQKQQYTNQLAKETDKYIKEFGSLPTTPSEQRQRKIQKDRLVAEFTTSLTNFQKVQRQAAEKEKEFVARVRASSRVSGGFPEDSSKERNLVSWESQAQPQVQVQEEEITEDDLRLIHERESSIRQLEADIMDINEIFKDLGMMIHEQGDVIDSIEANVESADVHVQQANQQLSRAAEYQGQLLLSNSLNGNQTTASVGHTRILQEEPHPLRVTWLLSEQEMTSNIALLLQSTASSD
ncbi:syntaxin-7 isoform X1 [Canis lupus familiaris]|nr:syntaxin-7 isoform X1 [Canis lupus familiaris]XP_038510079.1 syntaxin-7 isoform X1 [Canis lupus familiaris]|eukprot:XP_022272846.1 syntaxin-7 isoform X1 [Canis lupus familiaris]